jgi:aminopeptidase N
MPTTGNDRERSAILDVVSYDVTLDLTRGQDEFWSRAEVHFRCRQPGAVSWADLHAASVRKATLNGADISGRYRDGRLKLPPLDDKNILVVEAEFSYSTATEGMHYVTDPEDGNPFVYGRAYPHGAPHIYCCFDQSDLRAVFTVSINTPQGWSCFANAPLISRPAQGQPGSWRFARTAPIAPWLTSLCAGPLSGSAFACARDGNSPLPITVQAVRSAADHLGRLQIAQLLRQSLAYYERNLSVPYPYEKCDVVFGPISPALAYSVTGLVIIQDQLLKPGNNAGTGLYEATVIAHELAHAWFGGLVTLPGHDMWLDEALTTYISREALAQTIPATTP